MEIPLYEFVMASFAKSERTYQEISDGSGVNKRTVEKIARREIGDPGVSNVQKLADYFRAEAVKAKEAKVA